MNPNAGLRGDRSAHLKASENSSLVTLAIFNALRSVPVATSRCMGMTHPISPPGVTFFMTTWLPRWRSTENPSRCKALTASMPDTNGSPGMSQFELSHLGGSPTSAGKGLQIKFGGFLQVEQRFLLGFPLRGGADFRALRHQQIRLLVGVNDGGERDHDFRLLLRALVASCKSVPIARGPFLRTASDS